MKSLLFLSISLFLLVQPALGQHTISGIVQSTSEHPISFASISLHQVNDSTLISGVISDKEGKFELSDLGSGNYQLTIQMLGFQDWTQIFSISEDLVLEPIIMKEEALELGEVEVVARQSVLESHLGKKVLRIGQDLSNTGSTALEALDNIPSVTTTPQGQLQIRGSSNVIIYINGKETRRDPSTLRFISAEALEKIELVTNPSSKYDAEGVAGIINLVYRKDSTSSFKLEAISNLSILTNPFYLSPNGGLAVSYSKEKISFNINLTSDYGRYQNLVDSKRENFSGDLKEYENLERRRGMSKISNANIGFSVEPDSTLSMGLELNYDRWDVEQDVRQTSRFDYQSRPDADFVLYNDRDEIEDELWINYSLEKNFKSKKVLNLSLSAGGENEINLLQGEDIDQSFLPENIQQFLLSSDVDESQRYYQAKADYEASFFGIGKLEAGLKADFIRYNILQKTVFRSDSLVIPDNDFSMDMQKLGLYLLQNHQYRKLEYALGVRLEQFSSEAIQRSNNQVYKQNYLRLFPSIQFNYLLPNHQHTLGINYTRRIDRPGFFDLNPFVSYDDPLNLSTGNPALRPEIANLYEINYHREFAKLGLDLTLYQRSTTDAIQSVVSSIGNEQSLASYVNIGQKRNRGIEAQIEYRYNEILKSNGSFTWGQSQFSDQQREISFNKQSSWSTRIQQQIHFDNDFKIDITAIYRAPSYQFQRRRHAEYYSNISIGSKFHERRGTWSFSVRDLFNTRKYAYSLRNSDFEVEQSHKWQTRQINLGLRYTIFDGKR